jgi:hypothetical protein
MYDVVTEGSLRVDVTLRVNTPRLERALVETVNFISEGENSMNEGRELPFDSFPVYVNE